MVKKIKRWWPFVVLVLMTLMGFAWFTRRETNALPPMPDLGKEYKALSAEGEAAKAVAALDTEKALAKVKEDHAEALEALDEQQKAEAAQLESDPEALAGFLVRAAS